MLISYVPPTASLDVLSAELATAARDRRLATYLDQPVRIGALSVTAAHPFSVVDVDELVNADSLGAAAPIDGWRYLLEVNQRPVALATVDIDPAGRHRFGGIGTGPAVSSVVYAVHIAEALLQARPGDFQFDARDVPAVHTVVLRVTDRAGGGSAFLPVGLATALHPARLYSRAEMQQALLTMAARRTWDQDTDGPVGG